MKIELFDTFNNKQISSHNSVLAAVRKQRKHMAAVKRTNGQNSYITYAFRHSDGTPVDADEITKAQMSINGY